MINIQNLKEKDKDLRCLNCSKSKSVKNIYFHNKAITNCIRLCVDCRTELLIKLEVEKDVQT